MDRKRLWDLVRQQRMELHDAELISDEEYAELASDGGSVKRICSYDDMREEIKTLKERINQLEKKP